MLLTEHGRVKICDLGLARTIENTEKGEGKKYYTIAGTDVWMAPEVILGESYDFKCDVFRYITPKSAPPPQFLKFTQLTLICPKFWMHPLQLDQASLASTPQAIYRLLFRQGCLDGRHPASMPEVVVTVDGEVRLRLAREPTHIPGNRTAVESPCNGVTGDR